MEIGEGIILWYQQNKRDLPWRKTRDPYRIWLSEIILQQTRVNQGIPYYNRFIKLFPKIFDLALAPQDIVLNAWQGLGYYSRALNLHRTSKIIALERGGDFPRTFAELRSLPGIGAYTAAAIASFCFNEPVPVLDGNVYRVLSRIFGIYSLPDHQKGRMEFFNQAQKILGNHDPSLFNQGMMEFGALLCKPVNPLCDDCPFQAYCFAYQKDKILDLPVKKAKNPLKIRYFNYLVFRSGWAYLIRKRGEADIWPGLFEFPLIETAQAMEWEEIECLDSYLDIQKGLKAHIKPYKIEYSQILSHQKIFFSFWVFDLARESKEEKPPYFWVEEENLNKYAFPKVTHKLVKEMIQDKILK
jgi:A/G-specific adenine glycosylase